VRAAASGCVRAADGGAVECERRMAARTGGNARRCRWRGNAAGGGATSGGEGEGETTAEKRKRASGGESGKRVI
jgi:hypothetical protein